MPTHLIAEEGPLKGLILDLEDGSEWVIGRDPETCDFSLEDATVSRKHARLKKTENGLEISNLSKVNPTLINGEEQTSPFLLTVDDRIQIGNTIFVFQEGEMPDTGMAPKKSQKVKKKSAYDDIFGDIEEPEEVPEAPLDLEKTIIEPNELLIPPAPPKPELTAYDTIFEDVGDEDAIPFNLIPENPLMLKVIAGPNAGAEIGLEKGRSYIIGKDPNTSDIVFQDLSVSRNHAKLTVSEDGVIDIEDLGSKNGIAINGAPLHERRAITGQDMVALGTTVFLVIDREAPQETIYSPIVPIYEPPKEETPVAIIEEPPPGIESNWKKEPIPTKYLLLAGSIAAIFLVMFLTFFSLFKADDISVAKVDPAKEIKDALNKYPAVQFSYNPGSGKLFLVGHVLTPVDYQELRFKLSQVHHIGSVEDNVVIDEGVWKMMNDIISDTPAWRGVSIHCPVAGKFVVSGYLATNDEYNKLSDYLTVNFPYLDRLENDVVTEDGLNTQLQSVISAQQVGAITFQLTNGNVILTGRYNEELKSHYDALLRQINAIKGVQSVKNFAIATSPNQAALDLTQQYQVGGSSTFDGRGYSVVLNGKIYTLGDLVDGMKITLIEKQAIFLEKDGLKYKIDYVR